MDIATVTKIARLARIGLSEEEKTYYAKELSTIVTFVEQLQAVDTSGVTGLASVADVTLPRREDAVTDGHQQAAVLANAPFAEHGCFGVPKVIE